MIFGGNKARRQDVGIHVDLDRNIVGITTVKEGSATPVTLALTVDNAIKVHKAIGMLIPQAGATYVLPDDLKMKIIERVVEQIEVERPKPAPKKTITTPPKKGTMRYKVYSRLKKKASTDEELQLFLGVPMDSVRPRRGELVKGGYVRDSGKRRVTSKGDKAIVWEAVPNG